ncbi:MAG TPA: O-antigen ligase family protein [Candidatus Omnitrophota bacterium]|nr:O-antigen ligase family protein [Candidatus Omnitrophota bacterium]
MKHKTTRMCEFLWPLYFMGFALLRPVVKHYEEHSTLILVGFASLISVIFFFNYLWTRQFKWGSVINFILIVTSLFSVDMLLRGNSFSNRYFYEFLYGPLVSVFLLSQVRDTKHLLFVYSFFSLLLFVLFCADPFRGYAVFGDYMGWGFSVATPAFMGLYLGARFLKMRWMFIFAGVCFFETLVYANRGAFLSIVFFLLLMELFLNVWNFNKMIKYLIFSVFVLFLAGNIESIFLSGYDFVKNLGYKSYALEKFFDFLFGQGDSRFMSDRDVIWRAAIEMIDEKLFWGHGMGAFQERFDAYSHNIFLDFAIFYGVVGALIFLLIIFFALIKALAFKEANKLLAFLFLCLWFPKLFFSLVFVADTAFWCFLSFGFMAKNLLLYRKKLPSNQGAQV